jgi:hypothetical protein
LYKVQSTELALGLKISREKEGNERRSFAAVRVSKKNATRHSAGKGSDSGPV